MIFFYPNSWMVKDNKFYSLAIDDMIFGKTQQYQENNKYYLTMGDTSSTPVYETEYNVSVSCSYDKISY